MSGDKKKSSPSEVPRELEGKINGLVNRRAELLFRICEDQRLYHPDAIMNLVHEVRSITQVLKILKGETNGERGDYT